MRRAGLVGCLVAAAMLAGACSGGDPDEGPPSGAPSNPATDEGSGTGGEVDFPAPTRRQLAKGVRVGDQTTQALSDVVARGQTLVAVGGEFADNTSRPLFVLSTDGGDTWTRSEVTDPAREMTTSESATSVARSRHGFVAIGNDNEGPVIWSSPDGVSWARQKADRAVFKAADWVERVRYVDGRFVLIGGNEAAAGAAHDRVIMWTSRNGAQWKRVDLTTRGIDDVVGEPSAVDVTYYRGDLIIAGGVENNAIADQPNRIVIWRSRNGGRSFTTDSTPADLAGDYRAYADDFVLNGGELYLTASGDGTGKTWDAVVLRATGGAWEKITAAPLSTAAADHPGALIGVSDGWVYGGRTTEGAEDARIATGGTFADLAALRHPDLTARGRQLITAGAAVGRRAILVGITDASGSTEPAIWRVERGRATPVRLPAEVTGGRPHIYVTEILRTDRGWTAVGTVGLSPVVWRSADLESWTPQGLTGRNDTVSSINVTGADLLADGRVLIVGSANKPLGDDAIAWVETRKQGWKQVKSEAFANRGEAGYGSLFPNDVGVGPQAIAMPAGGYSDGESEVHPLRSTSDGEFWAPLISAGAADVEQQGEGTRYRDYRAPLDGDISMNSVSVTRSGFVLGGSRTPAGRGAIPVIWRGDAALSTLPLSTTLPKPRGTHGASVTVEAAQGRTIVLAGTTWASAGQPDPGWASWVSRNGGRTWQVGRPVADSRVRVSDLVAVPDGFVALGSTGPSADTDAAVWFSPDGLRWSEVDVELDRASGPGTQSFTSGIVDGDELRLVGYDVPPTGGGPYTTSIPLPAG